MARNITTREKTVRALVQYLHDTFIEYNWEAWPTLDENIAKEILDVVEHQRPTRSTRKAA